MAKPSSNNLLTIGETFKTVAGEFTIIRRLGQGATGEVYQAQSRDGKRMVAIKLMRPTDMQLARKLFIGEGLFLAQMRLAEKKEGDGLFVAPEYFGAEDKTDTPYIVEEFMMGKPFSDLVNGGHLSEEDVVTIGVQFFRTLHLLSKELKKNYIDLKFENLWWDQEKKILKITDWGTLEETNSAGQARDILRASLYIYRLATSRPITESRGVLNQAVEAYPEWEQLSWGLQEILRRLLHPNPSARVGDDMLLLDSAERIAQEFRNLDEYWKESTDDLLSDIRRSVDAAQKANPEKEIEKQTIHYRLARTALEIASKRGIPNKEFGDRLRSVIVVESDYYTRAHNLYEGTSYAPARKLFQIGARLLTSSKLRRWAWLAFAGELAREKNYRRVKAIAEQALELMELEQYHDARISLDTVLGTLQSEALQILRQECEVLNLVQQAIILQRDGEYKSAEDAYRSAYEIWIKTDDHDEWKDKVGDLLRQADIVHRRGENQGKVNTSLKKAETSPELSNILDELQKALGLDPGNLIVYTLAAKLADERFKSGLLEDAAQILWACGIAPATPPDALDWRYPKEIYNALAFEKIEIISLYVSGIRTDKNRLPYKLAMALFEKYFILSNNVSELDRDNAIADLMATLDPERSKEMKEQVQGWRKEILRANKEKVNQLLAEAGGLLFADRPGTLLGLSISQALACSQNRLQEVEKALGLLDQASRLAGTEDEAVKLKMKELKERGGEMKDKFSQSFNESKKQKDETIAALIGKAEEILAQLKQLEDASPILSKAGLSSQISDSMLGFQAERLGEVFELCTQVLDLDSENQWALQKQQNVKGKIHGLGDFGTLAIAPQKNVLNAAVEVLLREAEGYYQDAKVLDAARSLRKIEALDLQANSRQPFMELKAKVTALLGLNYWEQENKARLDDGEFEPQLLERILTHFSGEIPTQFRRNSASLKYLFAVRAKLLTQLLTVDPLTSLAQFTETLRNLVWTDNLYRRGLFWQNNQPLNQENEDWSSAKFVEKVLQSRSRGNLNQEKEKILAGLPIFTTPEVSASELTSELIQKMIPPRSEARPVWLKWVTRLGLSTLILGVLIISGILVLPLFGKAQTTPVPTVDISPTFTPIVPPTNTLVPVETPTIVITQTSIPIVPNLCIINGGKIRSEPISSGDPIYIATQPTCLYFDASWNGNNYIWYRIANGQKIGDLDVSGFWVASQFLAGWIPPTVTPTPSQ